MVLQDDLWRNIALFLEPRDVVVLSWTGRRLHQLLANPQFLEVYIQVHNRMQSPCVKTLEQLAVSLSAEAVELSKEHRIGFPFASLEIADDDNEEDEDASNQHNIRNSQARIRSVQNLLKRHPSLKVQVYGHVGTIAPRVVAALSLSRALQVAEALQTAPGGGRINATVDVHGWGKQIALRAAAERDHPHSALARVGKGWAEIYLELDGLKFPSRPSYYEGVILEN